MNLAVGSDRLPGCTEALTLALRAVAKRATPLRWNHTCFVTFCRWQSQGVKVLKFLCIRTTD
jgi:hypothetical protein